MTSKKHVLCAQQESVSYFAILRINIIRSPAVCRWTGNADEVGMVWVRTLPVFSFSRSFFYLFLLKKILLLFIIIAGSTKKIHIYFLVDVKGKNNSINEHNKSDTLYKFSSM